jgi:hypothetical protein
LKRKIYLEILLKWKLKIAAPKKKTNKLIKDERKKGRKRKKRKKERKKAYLESRQKCES